jgi:hypothetical protein
MRSTPTWFFTGVKSIVKEDWVGSVQQCPTGSGLRDLVE